MLRIHQLKMKEVHTPDDIRQRLLKILSVSSSELLHYEIRKKSLDARRKPELFFVYTIDFSVKQEEKLLKRLKGKVSRVTDVVYPIVKKADRQLDFRPVVTGSGPAGLFCAYLLAQAGLCPIILERGGCVEERKKAVERFWQTGVLDPQSNVQFGEGGAGTFSDGKLNTLVKDTFGRNRYVLETFVKFGAPEDILYEQKPHIGTDILIQVIKNMRNAITELGGEIRFHHTLTGIDPKQKQIQINGEKWMDAKILVLALGHSARDTFEMLYEQKLSMEAKSFAVGVRIEHPQKWIDTWQYGREDRRELSAASYKLAEKLQNGRGVYSFCMCPGGYVVNASSEEGYLAVNGMSYHGRAGDNANSAIVVTVSPEDFGNSHPLAGMHFQRMLEKNAWQVGGGKIPVQRLEDFCGNKAGTAFHAVHPNMKGAYSLANVRQIFPCELARSIEQGIQMMDNRMHGFADGDALLSGVESRTSSPVRIVRNKNFTSNIPWIYPCGEGAGYAGGITSAAMDGMKTAEAVLKVLSIQ